MNNTNLQRRYALRKFKGIGLASAVIGLFFANHSVSASVVSNGTDSATIVNDISKVSSTSATTFTDDKDATKNVKVDAVLGKGVGEPIKANNNTGDADGSDILHFKKEVDINYNLVNSYEHLKTKTVDLGSGIITTPYDKKGLAADTDGKDYRESKVVDEGEIISEELGKEDILEIGGKIYAHDYSEVSINNHMYDKTSFNDIEVPVSPEGMHNKLGEINYKEISGKVYLVEELSDGQYGKFVLAENGVSSDEDAVTKWKEGQSNAKEFTKENVTFQHNDTILVMDRDTYATVESSKQTTTTKKGEETYFKEQITPFTWDDTATGYRRKFTLENLSRMNDSNPKRYRKPGEDGKFGTSDDIVSEDIYKIGEENVYRTYLIVGAGGSGVHVGKKNFGLYYGTSVLTSFSLPEDALNLDPDYDPSRYYDTSNVVFGRYAASNPKPTNMFDALKGYAGRVYHALNFLEKSIEEKAKVLNTEEDNKKTKEDKAKVDAARKKLDDYLEAFAKKIKDENLDVGIIESNDQHNGELVFNSVITDKEVDASGNLLKYESLYKFTQFLNGLLKIPQAVGELSIEGVGPHGGMDDFKGYDSNSKVHTEFEYITTGYTFSPVIDEKEMKETEDKFKLIEDLYKKQKSGTISKEELKALDKEITNFVFFFKPKAEGLAKINSRGREEIRKYKNLNDLKLTDVKLDEKNTKIEEKEVDTLITTGTLTTLPDGKIKVEHEEAKDTPEYTEKNEEKDNSKITTKIVTRTRVETVGETIYTKKEIITPIRAYKVMSDVKSVVNHYYYPVKEERRWDPTVSKKGSVVVKYVATGGKELKSEVDIENVTLETTTLVELYSYAKRSPKEDSYMLIRKVGEHNEVKTVEQNYDTTSKQYPTLKDPKTGFTYEFVGLKQGSAPAAGEVVEGTTEVIYEYRLVSEEETTPSKSDVTKTGSVDVKHVVINEDGTLKTLRETEVIKDKVPLEYEDTYVTYSKGVKVSERKEKRTITEKYDTTDKQYPTLKDEATGLVYKFVGTTSDSSSATGDVTEGEKHVIYSYTLDKHEETTPTVTDTKGSVVVKYVDADGNEIKDAENVVTDAVVKTTKTYATKSGDVVLSTRDEVKENDVNYTTVEKKVDTITKEGKKYVFRGVYEVSDKFNNVMEETGKVKEGTTTVVYQYDYIIPVDPSKPNEGKQNPPKLEEKVPKDPKNRTYEQLGVLKEVKRNITYVYENGPKTGQQVSPSVEQIARFTRAAEINSRTGEVVYTTTNWTAAQKLSEVVSPTIKDYTVDKSKVDELAVQHDSKNSTVVVKYSQNVPIIKRDEAKDKKGTVIVKFIDINGNPISNDKVVKDDVIVEKATTKVSGGKEEIIYNPTGEKYVVTPPQTIEVDGFTFKFKWILPKNEKWNNSVEESDLVKEGVTTIVYQYVLQLKKAPEVETPEYTGGAVTIDPPVVDVPEYRGLDENPVSDSIPNGKHNLETQKTENETPKQKNSVSTQQSGENENPVLQLVPNQEELPQTGTGQEIAIFSAAVSSILVGLGLMVPTSKKKNSDEIK